MASLLEDIQPSWMQDGLGIVGEQSEPNFDDDTEWDTTCWSVSKQQQEDFIKACCDDCCTRVVTFYDVVIGDCPCQLVPNEEDGIVYRDLGGFNENPVIVSQSPFYRDDPDITCVFCELFSDFGDAAQLLNLGHDWNIVYDIYGDDCETFLFTIPLSGYPIITYLDFDTLNPGLWTLLCIAFGADVLFYGTTSDLTLPINNLITECAVPGEHYFTATGCNAELFNGQPRWTPWGIGGTATVANGDAICGACCTNDQSICYYTVDENCSPYFPDYCYLGDNVPCDPYPCVAPCE